MASKIVMKDRTIGVYKYVKCPECEYEIKTEKPIRLDLPYGYR